MGSPVQKPTLHRSISTKVLLAEGDDSPFTEHCRHYEDSYRVSGLGWASEERPHPFKPKCSGQTSSGHQGCQAPLHRGPHSAPSLQGTQAHTGLSAPPAPASRDAEPEGPGTGAAPGPHQAPFAHQSRDHGRHLTQGPAGGRPDCLGVCFRGGPESSLSGGSRSQGTSLPCSPTCQHVGGLPQDRKWVGGTLAWGPRRPSQALEPGLCCLEPRNFLGAPWNHGNCLGAPCGSEQLEDRNATNGTSNSAMCNIQLTFSFRFGRTPTSGWLTNRRYMKVLGSCC